MSRLCGGCPSTTYPLIHAAAEFRVAFCGFSPGFGYLTGAAGPVRCAAPGDSAHGGSGGFRGARGPVHGVIPCSSPGGWQLIGTTDAVLWDHGRMPAALLAPGHASGRPGEVLMTDRALAVVRAGALTTVQDRAAPATPTSAYPAPARWTRPPRRWPTGSSATPSSRPYWRRRSTDAPCVRVRWSPWPSPARPARSRWAAVRRRQCPCVSPPERCWTSVRPAWGRAVTWPSPAELAVDPVSAAAPRTSCRGSVRHRSGTARCCLWGAPTGMHTRVDVVPHPGPPSELVLRVTPGPRDDWFTVSALRTLATGTYRVSSASNRIGLRTEGPSLERTVSGDCQ